MHSHRLRGTILLATLLSAAACNDDAATAGPADPAPVVTVELTLAASRIEIGQSTVAIPVVLDESGAPVNAGPARYVSSAPSIAKVDSVNGAVVAVAPGSARITVRIGAQTDNRTVTVFKSPIRINEVKPNGDTPLGWIELFNPSSEPIDLGGWTLTSGDGSRPLVLRPGTAIAARGFLVIDEEAFPLGLAAADRINLISRFGDPVDTLAWSANLTPSAGRCTDGAGGFVINTAPSRGTPNACPEIISAASAITRR